MTTVSALPTDLLHERLRGVGLTLRTGPFNFRLRSPIRSVSDCLALLYQDYPLIDDAAFADFEVSIAHGRGLHRWFRPQARFVFDGTEPFEPLPVGHAYPLLEWAMNWCISTHAHHFLQIHAAVIERDGFAAILPAPPGSGKSTLCAALIHRGWRLLSDELAMIDLHSRRLVPLVRPVSLKNQSLDIIRRYVPEAVLTPETHDTVKGTVAHLKAPSAHVQRADETAGARWIVFPRYVAGAAPRLAPRRRADTMYELSRNSFNYGLLGLAGFEALADVVAASECHAFEYSRLDDAVETFARLAERAP